MVNIAQAMRRPAKHNSFTDLPESPQGLHLSLERTEWLPMSPPEAYKQLIISLSEIGAQVEKDKLFSPNRCVRILDQLLDYPTHFVNDLHSLTFHLPKHKESLARHAVHVTINALMMGRAMGFGRKTLLTLATAALFHELGMHAIPPSIREKQAALTPDELDVIRQHPDIASSLLLNCGMSWLDTAMIIQQEHERIDGSGYPRGLRGNTILLSASIIGLLDFYESLINSRPHRNRISAAEATMALIKQGKNLFPPAVIKHFLNLYSFYPVSSYVRLNNGAIAVVTGVNSLAPMKPVVKLVADAHWQPVTGAQTIDLTKISLLYIKEVLSENMVREKTGWDSAAGQSFMG
ncbi:MAG: HD domain-containing phosphohydrolase, partial [Desulfobulbaceae bacterium]|nr:HD domain-containing phosphohydrolase [Desulfobulbaceae bacterium]